MVHPELTLEKRIAAEYYSFHGTYGVYAEDLRGNVVAIGADEPYETASTIKAFILACLYDQVRKGIADLKAELSITADDYVNGSGVLRDFPAGSNITAQNAGLLMIIVSDNIAANMLIRYLGMDTINSFIQSIGCEHTKLLRALHFDDPEAGMLGITTPRDYGRFFGLLARKELVSTEASEQMLSVFRRQHLNGMLIRDLPVYYLDSEETGAEEIITVASKSGSMDACRNDGGIISTPYGSYVLVLLHKDFEDILEYPEHPAFRHGGRVSRMVFDQYLALEGKFRA